MAINATSKLLKTRNIGAGLWAINIQYFIVQIVAAAAWTTPFSLRTNYISDLGNTVCGMYNHRYVCSPDHMLTNSSFIILGVTQLLGAMVLMRLPQTSRFARVGYATVIVAGIGTTFVGLFPENTVAIFHTLGATMPFLVGNLSPFLIARGNRSWPTWLRRYSYCSTAVGLGALVFFMTGHYGWLDAGGIERVVAYPQTIWLIIVGFNFLLRRRSL